MPRSPSSTPSADRRIGPASGTSPGRGEAGLHSVAAALDVLDCFARDAELGVSEIARRIGMSKSSAHRLLSTLASRGLVEQSPTTSKYRLGVRLFELGDLAVSRIDLRRESQVLLEELRERSGMTVHLAVASGADVLYLERLSTLRGMRAIGEYRRRWPLHATSSGKAICAHDPVACQARIEAGFPVFTSQTVADEAAFADALAGIRRVGYATATAELMPNLASVAAAVLDRHGVAMAAISITGSVDDLGQHQDRQTRLVVAAAKRLSEVMQRASRAGR